MVTAASPSLTAVTAGWLVSLATTGEGGQSSLVLPVALFIGFLVLVQVAESAQRIAADHVARQLDGWMRRGVRSMLLSPAGIAHLESSAVQDDAARAGDLGESWGRQRSAGTAVTGQVVLSFRMISAGAAAVVLAGFAWWHALVLLITALITRAVIRRQWLRLADVTDGIVPDERRAEYWYDLATSAEAAKEVRLFGLAGWLTDRGRTWAEAALRPLWWERRRVLAGQLPIIVLTFSTTILVLLLPGVAAARGDITAGELATYLVASWGVFGISYMGHEAFDIEYGLGAVRASHRLRDRLTERRSLPVGIAARTAPHIEFDNVSFAYTGSAGLVLDGLSLDIRPGEILGIVGRNGAGKSTLIKLLAGLYSPTRGHIRVDGEDLASLDVETWRSRQAALFQDFVRYPLSVAWNVALSAPGHLDDLTGIRAAAEAAGIGDVLAGSPAGLDTSLWRGTSNGVDLSGGQWQKLGIARMLFARAHGRMLLILDEPTAHLDVRAEAAFFDTIASRAEGASVILISHRLSAVRNADRIVVLSQGRIVEAGDHAALLAAGGEYARLFRLQAARFTGSEAGA
ncbi:ABC transporter ATP-binding protein [Nonomuraea sp. SMC257]|uniref:ABC transporter ATP-binding protein n=1 Tax=Nonomuraea montanisoli TaxID=2741721 RepID=A0A7Y6ICX5_9ACTN|nr:ABC transporter ATP-binding protein [Nonomuraea montanisoli]NUW34554.1 ABC transporter ATP-binding protein [Nonomuraea montanisoli]